MEIANNLPIVLEGGSTSARVMDKWLGVNPNVIVVKTLKNCSQSFTQSDIIVQDQLLSGSDILLGDGSSLCVFKGATSREEAIVEEEQSKANWVDNGLHSQWGFTFHNEIKCVNNVLCQEVDSTDIRAWVNKAYELANEFNILNYKGARVKVVSQLNVKQFSHLLSDYKFSVIVDYAEFEFPLSMDYNNFSHIQEMVNHKSTTMFPKAVDAYINTEKRHNALVGPFNTSPFPKLHISPLMTRMEVVD